MVRIEITFDPSQYPQLQMQAPAVNPALIVSLLSQIITALSSNEVAEENSKFIVPAHLLPKIPKLGGA